jgi:UDP-N-acetylglucosamine 1-carboxyvinyltransferase
LDRYVIRGGKPLCGKVQISGAKNAAVAILPASILAAGVTVVENLPDISDVDYLLEMLESLGASIKHTRRGMVEIDTSHVEPLPVSYELARKMRASYYFLGALLGRFSTADVAMPGGCNLGFGVRPIDQHIKGFEALGIEVNVEQGMINAKAEAMIGCHIHFDVVSVGATVNVMMAAVRAKGVTILENAAKEPHIVDLANFLNSMGADIRGAGTDVIKIHGVDLLRPSTYSIIPDQIEAGTYMVAAAATRGDVVVENVIPKHLESITDKLIAAGAQVEEFDEAVRVRAEGPLKKVNIKTLPHPGFPTDMQPQITAMLCCAAGTSIITEGVWEGRFRYAEELNRMGASISVEGKIAVVEGTEKLTAARLLATDLRAGAALVIAALMTEGQSEIEGIEHIERGYDKIIAKLQNIGADIRRVSDLTPPSALAL